MLFRSHATGALVTDASTTDAGGTVADTGGAGAGAASDSPWTRDSRGGNMTWASVSGLIGQQRDDGTWIMQMPPLDTVIQSRFAAVTRLNHRIERRQNAVDSTHWRARISAHHQRRSAENLYLFFALASWLRLRCRRERICKCGRRSQTRRPRSDLSHGRRHTARRCRRCWDVGRCPHQRLRWVN